MKVVNHLIVLFSILFHSHLSVCSQDLTTVQAKIVDSKTNVPIPFATVKVLLNKVLIGGVISNIDGDFQIPSKYRTPGHSIVITCIGYSSLEVSMDKLVESQLNTIKLNATPFQLQEVVVSAHKKELTANKIVRLAIQNIASNCPSQPFSYVAYYRDYQKEQNVYVNLNEAIVGIFDKGFQFNDFQTTKIKLFQYSTNNHFKRDSMTAVAYDNNGSKGNKFIPSASVSSFGGNELTILRVHDAIRNHAVNSYSFAYKFDSDFFKNHSFKLLGKVYLDSAMLYHISFQSLGVITGVNHIAKGEIFIEQGNYAIHKLIYSTYLKESGRESLLYNIQVEYAKVDSLMYLNYVSFNNLFKAKSDLEFKVVDLFYDISMRAFIVTFNHAPKKATALDEKNYDFRFDKKHLKLNRIALSRDNNKEVQVFISNENTSFLKEARSVSTQRLEVTFKNIEDMNGRRINVAIYKAVSQFRELFLQKIDQHLSAGDTSLFIVKEKNLTENPIDSTHRNSSMYWMNTPLKEN